MDVSFVVGGIGINNEGAVDLAATGSNTSGQHRNKWPHMGKKRPFFLRGSSGAADLIIDTAGLS
ncbi:hypothetical protein [Streptosporangium sp. NPDC049078]|uniref:hypothetical protein n=1 Tax=Streptosporangium sp. NPDC049078 TaxID=3155767 RepID=UPI003415CE77